MDWGAGRSLLPVWLLSTVGAEPGGSGKQLLVTENMRESQNRTTKEQRGGAWGGRCPKVVGGGLPPSGHSATRVGVLGWFRPMVLHNQPAKSTPSTSERLMKV